MAAGRVGLYNIRLLLEVLLVNQACFKSVMLRARYCNTVRCSVPPGFTRTWYLECCFG